MKKIVFLASVLVLLSTAVVWGFMRPAVAYTNESNSSYGDGKFVFASSKTIWVPDNFTSIQEAINNASDGDTIFVRADTYYEHVIVNKMVSLIGENRSITIIDGNNTGQWSEKDSVIYITADNVTISGFTILNSGGYGLFSYPSGVCLSASNNCEITDNIIIDNNYGILVGTPNIPPGSKNNIISNNIIEGNNEAGVLLCLFSDNNTITGNTVRYHPFYGVWLIGGLVNNVISYNLVSENYYGISVVGWVPLGGGASEIFRNAMLYSWEDPSVLFDNNTISGNTVSHNEYGIDIEISSGNKISNNIVESNHQSVYILDDSDNNTVTGNTITSNDVGLSILSFIDSSSNNTIRHNNFINNTNQVYITAGNTNTWDDGYPSGGNYWSDYNGTDMNQDGIGDTSYEIDVDNTDNYPLMGMFSDFSVTHQEETYHTTTICNSTISEFQFNDIAKTISFNVTDKDGTSGFCRVTIPNIIIQDLWQGNYTVLVDGKEPMTMNNWTDGTYTYIYFTYLHSTHKVEIIPEFPTWTSMLLILVMLTVAIAVYKRRLLKQF